jgi:hypothetical protein
MNCRVSGVAFASSSAVWLAATIDVSSPGAALNPLNETVPA